MKIGYGYNAEPHHKDTLIDIAGEVMDKFTRAAVPGAFMVDILPFCKISLRATREQQVNA